MRRLRGVGLGALGLVIMAGIWELYKALAEQKAEGADVEGKAFKPITVQLKEGGK